MIDDDVRQQILREHEELRKLLDDAEVAARHFEAGEDGAGARLLECGLALYERFERHLDLEESILVPALRQAGETGSLRADRLSHEHDEQREMLRYLNGRVTESTRPTKLIASEIRNFAGYLRFDMTYEEDAMRADAPTG